MQTEYTAIIIVVCIVVFAVSVVMVNYLYDKHNTDEVDNNDHVINKKQRLFDYDIDVSYMKQLKIQKQSQHTNKLNNDIELLRATLKLKRQQYKQALKQGNNNDTTIKKEHSKSSRSKHSSLRQRRQSNSSSNKVNSYNDRVHVKHENDNHNKHSTLYDTSNMHTEQHKLHRHEFLQRRRQHTKQRLIPISQSITITSHSSKNNSIKLPSQHSRHNSQDYVDLNVLLLNKHSEKQQHNKRHTNHHRIHMPSSNSDESGSNNDNNDLSKYLQKQTRHLKKQHLQNEGKKLKPSRRYMLQQSLNNSINTTIQRQHSNNINNDGFTTARYNVTNNHHASSNINTNTLNSQSIPTNNNNTTTEHTKSIYALISDSWNSITDSSNSIDTDSNNVVPFGNTVTVNTEQNNNIQSKPHITLHAQPKLVINSFMINSCTDTDYSASNQHQNHTKRNYSNNNNNNVKVVPFMPMTQNIVA